MIIIRSRKREKKYDLKLLIPNNLIDIIDSNGLRSVKISPIMCFPFILDFFKFSGIFIDVKSWIFFPFGRCS